MAATLMARSVAIGGEQLTNGVPIQDQVRFSITDEAQASSLDAARNDKELLADRPLSWILENTSSKRRSVVFLGMTNSFAFTVRTPDGADVPKTEKGLAMSAGPISTTNFEKNRVRRLGIAAHGVLISDFPKLSQLFNFPSNGVFTLELRYWTWDNAKRKFVRSSPIRVNVKSEPAAKSGG
jgi:hypothetical protein